MSAVAEQDKTDSPLQRLLAFLDYEPGNLRILSDAAFAAYDEQALEQADALLARYSDIAPLTDGLLNLQGLLALKAKRFDLAAMIFEDLMNRAPAHPAVRFNLAWSKAAEKDYAGASALLDEETTRALAAAAGLKLLMLHHLDDPDLALAEGERLSALHPQDQALLGALSLVALDADDNGKARLYADQASASADGLTTQGLLALGDGQTDASLGLFDKALHLNSTSPRGLLGKGLAVLAKGDAETAIPLIEQAAVLFDSHIGSWIALGWAEFTRGDLAAARARFDRALAIDGNFAESHGSLAVIEIMQGQTESAERHANTALRLDRQCLSAALAKSMLAAGRGDQRTAARIKNGALNAPVGPNGETITQLLARMTAGAAPRI